MNNVKTDIAYSEIKRKIIHWELAPLSDISEDALQKELDISRTPIREAIKRLEQEGFVYIYPRKGTIVSEITSNLIKSVFEIREVNEPYIFKKNIDKISRQWLVEMKDNFLKAPKEINCGKLKRHYIDLDRSLHTTVIKNSDNVFLVNMLMLVYDHDQRIRINISSNDLNYENTIQEHIDIIDAMLLRDIDKVESIVTSHIRKARDTAIKNLLL